MCERADVRAATVEVNSEHLVTRSPTFTFWRKVAEADTAAVVVVGGGGGGGGGGGAPQT